MSCLEDRRTMTGTNLRFKFNIRQQMPFGEKSLGLISAKEKYIWNFQCTLSLPLENIRKS